MNQLNTFLLNKLIPAVWLPDLILLTNKLQMISNANPRWKSTLCDELEEFDQKSEDLTYNNPLCEEIVEDYEGE